MTAWLKVIGTSDGTLRDDWGSHVPHILRYASFAKPPGNGSFIPGDDFVYYALRGDISRVVAVGRVTGRGHQDESRIEDPGWPWLVPVEIEARTELISEGFPLDRFDVDRHLTKSVQRHSHISLRPAEYRLVRDAFGLT